MHSAPSVMTHGAAISAHPLNDYNAAQEQRAVSETSEENRKVVYLTCQACTRELRVRKDGKFPMHRVSAEVMPRVKVRPVCVASQTFPSEHVRG
jgi:hypothetical protein